MVVARIFDSHSDWSKIARFLVGSCSREYQFVQRLNIVIKGISHESLVKDLVDALLVDESVRFKRNTNVCSRCDNFRLDLQKQPPRMRDDSAN